MKITIIGGGNMGKAIACGLATSINFVPSSITVVDTHEPSVKTLKDFSPKINAVVSDYSSLGDADIVILAVKPWLVQEVLTIHKDKLNTKQLIVSIAAGILLNQLQEWTLPQTPIFRVMPNTAIQINESMSFVTSLNATEEQNNSIIQLFESLGQVSFIPETLFSAATALASCGIAYAFRYIQAAMLGGVEMGFSPSQAKDVVIQTFRGAINLLETNNSHPAIEIDKVTTPGGITIKGLNEMDHAGFTSAVIRGLKASNIK